MTRIPMWKIKFAIIIIILVNVYMYICVNACDLHVNVFRDHKMVAALQVFVSFWKWVLGTKLKSCRKQEILLTFEPFSRPSRKKINEVK